MKPAATVRTLLEAARDHLGRGDDERARELCGQALQLEPDDGATLLLLGVVYFRQRSLERAAQMFERVLELEPNQVDALWNLGLVQVDGGHLEQGLALLTRAAALRPASVAFQLTLGNVLLAAEQFQPAVERFRQALTLEPENIELSYRVLATLVRSERLGEAEQLARWASEQQPDSAARYIALGRVLSKQRRFSEAVAVFHQAQALEPHGVAVTTPLVEALVELGRVDDTVTELERAIAIDPTLVVEHSTLVYQTAFSSRHDAQGQLAAARRWSDVHAAPLRAERRAYTHDRSPERRLRVGYVSPDFRMNVQRFFTLPTFAHHDHQAFEIVGYSSVKNPDQYTQQISALTDEWHDVTRLSDRELAQKIRDDRIDVLIDLTLHMAKNRLRTFAEKPAPVQFGWLAYPGTTGVDGIDYRLTDPFLDPPGAPLPYSEQTLWLPHTFWCYAPEGDEGVVSELPSRSAGYVTFGCLNNFMKVSRATLELWARVLVANPGSQLLMAAPKDGGQPYVRGVLQQHGVDPARVQFVEFQIREKYLETYSRIDIALDTLPYAGHTTSLDAYWMGVPVVTLVGDTIVGRAGLSFASNLDLGDWVAHDPAEFVSIASRFAREPLQLGQLRAELRQRLQRSPLMDAPRFTRDLEAAYREAWRRFCAAPPG